MATPANQRDPVYDDDRSPEPVRQPDLRRLEGIGGNTAGGGTRGASSSTGSQGGGASNSTKASAGGASDQTGDTSAKLNNAEESTGDNDDEDDDSDRVGKGYTGNNNSTSRGRVRFRLTRKKAAVGIGSVAIISGVIGFFSISTGPLEFIHIAQLLDRFHFSSQQDAEDGRLTKMARYLHDTNKPQNTRLGLVGNSVASKLETKIKDATGLEPEFNEKSGRFVGYNGDRAHENFKGKSEAEIKSQIANQTGIDGIKVSFSSDGKSFSYNPDAGIRNPVTAYRVQTRTARAQLSEAGLSKVSQHVGSRILRTRAGWTFHPIKKADAALQAKAIEKGAKAYEQFKEKLKQQFNKDETAYIENGAVEKPGGDPTRQKETDTSGKTVDTPGSQDTQAGVNGVKSDTQGEDPANPQTVEDAKTSLKAKVGAGGASLIGVICVMNSINHEMPQLRQEKVMLPMMRMAGEAISVGSQVQSGQDISALQLGFYKDQLDGTDSTGKTSTWNQAQSIQAELGQPQSGTDVPKEGQVFNGDVPFGFLQGSIVDSVCGILGSTFGQIFSIVTGPISFIASAITVGPATSILANWLSGAPISPLAAGADRGNYINYGARLSANQQYASAGGVPMNSSDEGQVTAIDNSFDMADFQSHGLAYRLFNTKDSRSLVSHLIDSESASGPVDNIATMVQHFGSIFGAASRVPASLLSGVTHAAGTTYNWHGLNKIGFTASELGNPSVDNPFDNACLVAGGNCKLANGTLEHTGILDGSNGQHYIDLAHTCFNATITNDPSTGWQINNASSLNQEDDNYRSHAIECSSDSDGNWLRVRFWLLDTATIEGYDCYQGDTDTSDQSCNDVGVTQSSTASVSAGSSDISAYQNPLRDVMKNGSLFPRRIDEGVDYGGHGPIYAMGNGVVTFAGTGEWFAAYGQSVVYTLSDGPAAGKSVYFSESCTPTVKAGDHVTPSTVICNMNGDNSPWIETGWAVGGTANQDIPSAHIGYNECATVYGANYSDLLKKLGAPGGKIECGGPDETLPAGWPKW
ncbi:MAG TPA: M23 family metallopeptidase [Candidatus Saccharimonadales bacterium]|nr:M23 family metallopeptidase [Candidatus Saccharimonadales bacterium]